MCKTTFSALILLVIFGMAEATDFPHRAKYSDVKIIDIMTFERNYDESIIVDVRSKFEYDIIHVTNAVNDSIARKTFKKNLSKIREKHSKKPLIFYCNGKTCQKSYRATRLAKKLGYSNVYVYDGGITEWMEAYPEKTTLLQESPASLGNYISDDKFHSHLLDVSLFREKVRAGNVFVIDIRDPMQREIKLPFRAKPFPLDKFKRMLRARQFKNKQLLIVDSVGKQSRWLQYLLEKEGYSQYYFLKKGALAFSNK